MAHSTYSYAQCKKLFICQLIVPVQEYSWQRWVMLKGCVLVSHNIEQIVQFVTSTQLWSVVKKSCESGLREGEGRKASRLYPLKSSIWGRSSQARKWGLWEIQLGMGWLENKSSFKRCDTGTRAGEKSSESCPVGQEKVKWPGSWRKEQVKFRGSPWTREENQ